MENRPRDYYDDVNSIEELVEKAYQEFNAFEKFIYWIQRYFWLTFILVFVIGFLAGSKYANF